MPTIKTLIAANDNTPATLITVTLPTLSWEENAQRTSAAWLASLSPDERAEFAAVETAEADRIAVTYGMPVAPDGRYSLLMWSLVGGGQPSASLSVGHTVAM